MQDIAFILTIQGDKPCYSDGALYIHFRIYRLYIAAGYAIPS